MERYSEATIISFTILCSCLFQSACRQPTRQSAEAKRGNISEKPIKYVACFMPGDFGQFQGEFTHQIMDVIIPAINKRQETADYAIKRKHGIS